MKIPNERSRFTSRYVPSQGWPCKGCCELFQCSFHPNPAQRCSPERKQLKQKEIAIDCDVGMSILVLFRTRFRELWMLKIIQTINYKIHNSVTSSGHKTSSECYPCVHFSYQDCLTKWCIHQDGIIELCWSLGNVNGLHLFKAAKWMALGHKLRDGPLMQSSSDQQNDIVNHIAVSEKAVRQKIA